MNLVHFVVFWSEIWKPFEPPGWQRKRSHNRKQDRWTQVPLATFLVEHGGALRSKARSVRLCKFSLFSHVFPVFSRKGSVEPLRWTVSKGQTKAKDTLSVQPCDTALGAEGGFKAWGLGWAEAIHSIASALHPYFTIASHGFHRFHGDLVELIPVCLGTGCTTFTTKRTKPWKLGSEKDCRGPLV